MKKEIRKFLKYLGMSFLFVYSILNLLMLIMNKLITHLLSYDIVERLATEAVKGININELKDTYRGIIGQEYNFNVSLSNEILFCSVIFSIIIAMVVYLIKDKSRTIVKIVIFAVIIALLVFYLIYNFIQIDSTILESFTTIIDLIKM